MSEIGLNCRTPSWCCRKLLSMGKNPYIWCQKCCECGNSVNVKDKQQEEFTSLHKTKRDLAQVEKAGCARARSRREQRPLHYLAKPLSFFSVLLLLLILASSLQNKCSPTHLFPTCTASMTQRTSAWQFSLWAARMGLVLHPHVQLRPGILTSLLPSSLPFHLLLLLPLKMEKNAWDM